MTTTVTAEKLPHWNLDTIYPGLESEAFIQAISELGVQVDELDKFINDNQITQSSSATTVSIDSAKFAFILEEFLKKINSAMQLNSTLRMYLWCIIDTDSSNELANRRLSEIDPFLTRLRQQGTQLQIWLRKHKDFLPAALASNEVVQIHSLFLLEKAELSRYLMSEPEEKLAGELSMSGINAWSKLHGVLWSSVEVPFDQEGKINKLPLTVIQAMAAYDPDGKVRERAGEAEVAAWATIREPLAAAFNGVMGTKVILNKYRGRPALQASLDQYRINEDILEVLLSSIQISLPAFRRYLQTKAIVLGKEKIPWWDIYAPIGQTSRKFSFNDARHIIIAQFERFSPRLGSFASFVFENNWIDAEPRQGKVGGAYCNTSPGTGISRVLCNFDGSLMELLGIAHELGHAFHNHCQTGKTMLQSQTPMTLTESASLFCENLVIDKFLGNTNDPQEELAILNTFLSNAVLNVVSTMSAFRFEKVAFEKRETAELSAAELCNLSTKFFSEIFGDAMDENHLHPYLWAAMPHNFMANISFYNFPYAYGFLFGLGLYSQYLELGTAFVPDFETLLASTGEMMPMDLARRFGINLGETAFWRSSLELIEKRIQRFEQLSKKLI